MNKVNTIDKKNRPIDLSMVLIFIIVTIAFCFGWVGTHLGKYPFLSGDAAIVSSYAAALDHPSLFINDTLFKNPSDLNFYNIIHIPIIRLLVRLVGNYGSAFALLLFPTTFLHLFGYYLLGNTLFKKRIWSILFTFSVMVPISLSLGEVWGLHKDALPRHLFQVLLPFVLAAIIHWGRNPKNWPWLMGLTGLLVYVHPMSLPAWGVAIFLGLWFLAMDLSNKKKITGMILAALAFMVVILPFTFNYLSTTKFGSTAGGNYAYILQIKQERMGYLDLKTGYKDFVKQVVFSHPLNLSIWIMIPTTGFGLYLYYRKQKKNWLGLTIAAWWAGIFIVGVLIPIVDHTLMAALKRMPLEIDLIRSLRYVIPLLLLTAFYILSEIGEITIWKAKNRNNSLFSSAILILGFCLMLGWMLRYNLFNNSALLQTASCWKTGHLVCPFQDNERRTQRVEFLDMIKTVVPEGGTILGTDISDLAIRYYALRPLVYSYKDGSTFIFTDQDDLMRWYRQYLEMGEIEKNNPKSDKYLDEMTRFAQKYQAEYIVLPYAFNTGNYLPEKLEPVFSNQNYSLFKVEQE